MIRYSFMALLSLITEVDCVRHWLSIPASTALLRFTFQPVAEGGAAPAPAGVMQPKTGTPGRLLGPQRLQLLFGILA